MVELAQWQPKFAELGVNVTAMTYDSLAQLADFHQDKSLNYPLLRDADARHVLAFGILNDHYPAGDANYGIPHPGIIYLDGDGIVAAKFAAPGYRDRPSFEAVLKHIQSLQ